jgi:hypothetical protein
VQCCRWTATLFNSTPSVGSSECISKSTVNFQTAFFPPGVPLNEHLDLLGMVAQNSVRDDVNDRAHLPKRRGNSHSAPAGRMVYNIYGLCGRWWGGGGVI